MALPDSPTGWCASCGVHDGHSVSCPLRFAGFNGAADELTPEINEAIDFDDRKDLATIWQTFAPLPPEGLTERVYDALLHVAKYGARQALENRR